jgi:hypothetical protein
MGAVTKVTGLGVFARSSAAICPALAVESGVLALFGDPGQLQLRQRIEQITLGLRKLGGFDAEQRRTLFHLRADPGNHPDDPAGIRREDLGGRIAIQLDPPIGCLLRAKSERGNGVDC